MKPSIFGDGRVFLSAGKLGEIECGINPTKYMYPGALHFMNGTGGGRRRECAFKLLNALGKGIVVFRV